MTVSEFPGSLAARLYILECSLQCNVAPRPWTLSNAVLCSSESFKFRGIPKPHGPSQYQAKSNWDYHSMLLNTHLVSQIVELENRMQFCNRFVVGAKELNTLLNNTVLKNTPRTNEDVMNLLLHRQHYCSKSGCEARILGSRTQQYSASGLGEVHV